MGAYYDAPIGYPLSIPCQKSAMSPRSYWAERGLGYGFVDKVNIRVEWTF